jgi:hypothetical protein
MSRKSGESERASNVTDDRMLTSLRTAAIFLQVPAAQSHPPFRASEHFCLFCEAGGNGTDGEGNLMSSSKHTEDRAALVGPHLARDADAVLAGAFAVLCVRAICLCDARSVGARLGLLLLGAGAGNSAYRCASCTRGKKCECGQDGIGRMIASAAATSAGCITMSVQ